MKEEIYPIHPLLQKRRSPVAFSTRTVEEEKLIRLFRAAQWAPSSSNEQPWRFIYASAGNREEFGRMFETLADGNKKWVKNVPLLILSIAKKETSRGSANYYARHDVGLAVGSLIVQAMDMGLYVHQMGGFRKKDAAEVLGIPEEYEPVAMIAVGYPGDPEELSADLKEREKAERTRKPLERIVFRGKWDEHHT